jgi:TonB family protein
MRIRTAVVLGFATSAIAATAATAQPVAVTWAEVPSAADMAAAYPAKAKAAGVGGMANLSCSLNAQGHPRDCVALGEQPAGLGFGFAARKLAEKMRVAEIGLNGREVRIPVTFDPAVLKAEPITIARPAWAVLPSAADFQASFPKTANGVNEVRVAMVCTVGADGVLSGCAVDREEPAGQGYGQGALALAPKFRVGPWSQDGQPTAGAKVRVPIRYQLTQVAAPKG